MYLRTKKYSLNDAFKLYENHFNYRSKRGDWFDVDDTKKARIKQLIQCGSKYIINDPQSTDSAFFVERLERFDFDKNPFSDNFYTDISICGAYLELDNVQISGFTVVLDFTNVPLSVFTSIPVNDMLDWARSVSSCPGRYKRFILMRLPSVAYTLLNLVKMVLPEKMRNRIEILKEYDELTNYIDINRLPIDFGGKANENDLIQETLRVFDEKMPSLKSSNKYDMDMSMLNIKSGCKNGFADESIIGSFRKLEID